MMVLLGAGGQAVAASPVPTWSSAEPPAERAQQVLNKAAARPGQRTQEGLGCHHASLPGGRAAVIQMGKNRDMTGVTVRKPRKSKGKKKKQGKEQKRRRTCLMSCYRSLPLLTSAAPCSLVGAGKEPPVQRWGRMRSRAALRWSTAAVQGLFFGCRASLPSRGL